MNPSGIAAFYGAFDLDTCIAEIRPTVGSIVIGASFQILESMCVLDTTMFDAPVKEPNLFSKDHVKRMAQWSFMQRFMQEIAQPISPNDEHLDYIPTQAVAEYLINHHKFYFRGEKRSIEAVIYRSAQHPKGKNIVILGAAAAVEKLQAEKKQKPGPAYGEPFDTIVSSLSTRPETSAPPRLRVDPKSLRMRQIVGATFSSKTHRDFGSRHEAGYDETPF